ncbi:MAG: BclA C-terminal domain-containing protein [Christensenellales bacterium]|jgi:hypothetical protein
MNGFSYRGLNRFKDPCRSGKQFPQRQAAVTNTAPRPGKREPAVRREPAIRREPAVQEEIAVQQQTAQEEQGTKEERVVHRECLAAYGSVYQIGTEEVVVAVPGEIVPVTFSDNALLKRIQHEPGSAEIFIRESGDYQIDFTLYFTSTVAAFATFAIQADSDELPGGIFSKMLSVGYQVFSGGTMAALFADDPIRMIFTSGTAVGITLTGGDVTAFLNVKKLG